ncbi:cytochrome P450 monooxygenase [Fomitopsis serialis]|uniref:cytochrome P450 monooxygenase n=1 Tax=Fomitopsis serialis TaxID=139415 RepID=UPI0020077552|nr:cytochrome P450 monooxygenase [Neoantrodia serialis]KAH9917059.1 cytochrome P450 monooxygenase [Neoantrodia serialis]
MIGERSPVGLLTPHASGYVGAAVVALWLVYASWSRIKGGRRYPPGPKRLPFLGNIHQLPAHYQHVTFKEWGAQYGDVVYARFFSTPVLVLNSVDACRALLDKKGAKYSGRPSFTFHNEMYVAARRHYGADGLTRRDSIEWRNLVLMQYTEQWRRHRRWYRAAFESKAVVDSYRPLQTAEAHKLLSDLLQTPDGFMLHVKKYAVAIIMGLGYGISISSMDDEFIQHVDHAVESVFQSGGPAAMLIDFFPVLKYLPAWMPGAGFKRLARQVQGSIRDMEYIPLRRADGTLKPSIASSILEETMKDGKLGVADEREIASALGALYAAGTDTTATTLQCFVLAMVLHPEIQRKAQAELDRVVGDARLPDMGDRDALPYLDAIIMEVYRWCAPVPLGVPHQLLEDDEHMGYTMPRGSTVFSNIWAMTRDEQHYPEPERFDPARFLDTPAESDFSDPRRYVFGFGRRICPGRFLADASIWLAAAQILATLDIRKARTPAGAEITPEVQFASGSVSHPKPFACDIRPRSKRSGERVRAALRADRSS